MKTLVLTAEVANMEKVLDWLNQELEAYDVPMKAIMQLDIAVEELFVNIAHYAYNPDVGEACITVDVSDEPRDVTVRFEDWGKPYDPLQRQDPDVTLSAEERGVGGLGIFMVKKTMDRVVYSHENGKNILTITKRI